MACMKWRQTAFPVVSRSNGSSLVSIISSTMPPFSPTRTRASLNSRLWTSQSPVARRTESTLPSAWSAPSIRSWNSAALLETAVLVIPCLRLPLSIS